MIEILAWILSNVSLLSLLKRFWYPFPWGSSAQSGRDKRAMGTGGETKGKETRDMNVLNGGELITKGLGSSDEWELEVREKG